MKYSALLGCWLLFFFVGAYAQTETVLVPAGINLPSDSVTRVALLGGLRDWLVQKNGLDDLPATRALKDELKGMERRIGQQDTSYYDHQCGEGDRLSEEGCVL